VIGIGGMGAVYRARDMHFPNAIKLVAVKEMLNLASDPVVRKNIVENFEREAHILATLTHAAIPKIFDFFTFNNRSYLVLEYIQGKDLERILNETEEAISVDRVVGWAVELCDVLHYLHHHKPEPIIFRDMKPSNIMIDQQGHVVLIDFGIAKIFKTGQKGTMIGTEGYSPPEQYRGEASHLADIYSLGASLHHVLTRIDPRGQPPFTFTERQISKYNPGVPGELEVIVYTALQYNPTDRYPSAEVMKQALQKSMKWGSVILQSPSLDEQPGDNRTPGLLWQFNCEDEIRGSPLYHSEIIYFGSYDCYLYAIGAADGHLVWKYKTEGGIVGRPVLGDEDIYIGSKDKRMHAVSLRTGRLSWIYETGGAICSSAISAEGHIFFGSDDGFLYALNTNSMRCIWRVEVGSPVRSTPCIVDNAIIVGSEAGDILCVDFKGQTRWRFKAKRAVTSTLLADQGMVFFSSLDRLVYALDAYSGWVIWRFRMEEGSVSSLCKVEQSLLFGSADGHIYCIDEGNGRELWKFRTDHQVSGSPTILDEFVFCGSADGNLYSLDCKSGKFQWKYSTNGPITSTPVVHKDKLFLGSLDHILYALKLKK
jgi:serine/threonine protein kinase